MALWSGAGLPLSDDAADAAAFPFFSLAVDAFGAGVEVGASFSGSEIGAVLRFKRFGEELGAWAWEVSTGGGAKARAEPRSMDEAKAGLLAMWERTKEGMTGVAV